MKNLRAYRRRCHAFAPLTTLAALGACAPASAPPAPRADRPEAKAKGPLAEPLVFDFEDGTTQGWYSSWGTAFASGKPAVSNSSDLARPGNERTLALELAFNGGGWEEANIENWPSGQNNLIDLSNFGSLDYDLYVPDPDRFPGALKTQVALNDPFNELKPWGQADLAAAPRLVVGKSTYARLHVHVGAEALGTPPPSGRLVVRVAGVGSTYAGRVYLDDLRIAPPDSPVLRLRAPPPLSVVSDAVQVRTEILLPAGNQVNSVKASAAGAEVALQPDGSGIYIGQWDASGQPDGVTTLTVAAGGPGWSATESTEVMIANSGTEITFSAPDPTRAASGSLHVDVAVSNNRGRRVDDVSVSLASIKAALAPSGDGTHFTADLDLGAVPSGTHTLLVTARAQGTIHQAWTDVQVTSNEFEPFITRQGAQLLAGSTPFRYVGWNAYDLPFRDAQTLSTPVEAVTFAADGSELATVLPVGASLSFDEQIDREIAEARKLGLTVLRTWGFNSDVASEHPFYTQSWDFNEEQFARLDAVVDSARRHGVRVIIPFQNYWDDYGGIRAVTRHLGKSKLEFFTDPACQQMFRDYIAHLVGRTNTRNGRLYRDDPTIMAWELMNEPRMDINDDDTPDHHLYDPTGEKLGAWIETMAAYIKQLDPNHLVSPGAEGHGFEGWAQHNNEGYGSDPIATMDQPAIDLLTFHPYLNDSKTRMTVDQAKALVTDFTKAGLARGKPVLMEEWGFDAQQPLVAPDGHLVPPQDASFAMLRAYWYQLLPDTFRVAGGTGTNIWMLQTTGQDANYGVSVYTPGPLVEQDRPLTTILSQEAAAFTGSGQAQ